MSIAWNDPVLVKQKGRGNFKPIEVKTASGSAPEDRFHLYQTRAMAKQIPTMWVLFDQETGTQHYLYGEGWEGAQDKAAVRIQRILDPKDSMR